MIYILYIYIYCAISQICIHDAITILARGIGVDLIQSIPVMLQTCYKATVVDIAGRLKCCLVQSKFLQMNAKKQYSI